MSRYCKASPEEFERWIKVQGKHTIFGGAAWFETKDQLKQAARTLRKQFDIPVRSIIIPGSYTDGGAYGGYTERYLLMVSCEEKEPEGFIEAVKNCEGYTRG